MPLPLMQHGGGTSDELAIDPSELTCEVRFESPEVDPDTGVATGNWNDEGTDWAKIQPLNGRDLWLAMQANSRVRHKITCYWREGVKSDWRLIFETRIFNFDYVIDVLEQKTKLEILAIESPQPTI